MKKEKGRTPKRRTPGRRRIIGMLHLIESDIILYNPNLFLQQQIINTLQVAPLQVHQRKDTAVLQSHHYIFCHNRSQPPENHLKELYSKAQLKRNQKLILHLMLLFVLKNRKERYSHRQSAINHQTKVTICPQC